MNREEIFYLTPYILSLAITLGVFLYSWKHRRVRGAGIYTWFVGGQALTVLGFIFELVSPSLNTKIMWDKFQWLTDSFLVFIPFLIFSVQFSEYKLKNPRITWGYWLAFPIIFTLILLTDDAHHLLYPNPHLSADYPFPELQYRLTTFVYIYTIFYIYSVNFYGISLLIRRAVQTTNPYRLQYLTVAGGFLIPLILSSLALADIRITPQRDITPFSLALGNLIVALGLFRFGLFDIVPIARERIVENMDDPVIVLDTANRILDVNSAALMMIGRKYIEVVGHLPGDMFAKWPEIIEIFEKPHEEKKVVSIKTTDDELFFDFSKSPITNNRRELIGHTVVAHDITKQKALETSYRILAEELEKRVKERTEELAKSEEKFAKAFQADPDGIVLAEFETGRFVEVNEGFEKIFGYHREEVIGQTSLGLGLYANPADRQRFMTTLREQGRIQNDEYRIKTKQGQEKLVLVYAELLEIYNEPHIVTINRDITERKRAEEALRESEEKYRELVENLNDVIFTVNTDGILTYISSPARQLTGYAPDELVGHSFVQMIHPDDLLGINRSIRDTLDNRLEPREFRYYNKDGQIRWGRTSSRPILEGERVVGIRGLFSDITERKRAEMLLNEQLDELRRWHQATLGRETRILDLKREVNKLLAQAGQPPRYPVVETE